MDSFETKRRFVVESVKDRLQRFIDGPSDTAIESYGRQSLILSESKYASEAASDAPLMCCAPWVR